MHCKDEGTDTASLYHHYRFFFLPSPEMCAHISHTGNGKETVIQANNDGAWGTGAANQWPHPILVNSMFGPSTAADFYHLLSKPMPLQCNTAEACILITKMEVPDWAITPRHPLDIGVSAWPPLTHPARQQSISSQEHQAARQNLNSKTLFTRIVV